MIPFRARVEPGSNGNEEVLRIPQSSSITWTSPSDYLVSYLGNSLGGGSHPSAEVQLVYSTAPVDFAKSILMTLCSIIVIKLDFYIINIDSWDRALMLTLYIKVCTKTKLQ